jgi:hypothetical protein
MFIIGKEKSFLSVHTARVLLHTTTTSTTSAEYHIAAVHSLVLLMMGIIVPETCCDKRSIINMCLVKSC